MQTACSTEFQGGVKQKNRKGKHAPMTYGEKDVLLCTC